jgi:hypothetical protein
MSSQCLKVRKVASGSGGLARGIAMRCVWHDAVFIKVDWRDRPGGFVPARSFRRVRSGAFVSARSFRYREHGLPGAATAVAPLLRT